jgi:hypothetical protein
MGVGGRRGRWMATRNPHDDEFPWYCYIRGGNGLHDYDGCRFLTWREAYLCALAAACETPDTSPWLEEAEEPPVVSAEVTFYLRRDAVEALMAKAAVVDEENNGAAETTYTLPQALQVVWHHDPEWLHRHVLVGWTLDRAADYWSSEPMRVIWPT